MILLHYFDTIISNTFDVIHCPSIHNAVPEALSHLYPALPASIVHPSQCVSRSPQIELLGLRLVEDFQDRLYVVAAERVQGHFGTDIIANNIMKKRCYCWPNLCLDCERVRKMCVPCQQFKTFNHGYNRLHSIHGENPFDHVCIDLG